jgi:hypothetical protein
MPSTLFAYTPLTNFGTVTPGHAALESRKVLQLYNFVIEITVTRARSLLEQAD